jgi:membrane-associated phospholipid phosphatase
VGEDERVDLRPGATRVAAALLNRLTVIEGFLRRTLTDPLAGALTLVVGFGIAGLMGLVAAEIYDAVSERDGVAGFDRPVLDWFIGVRTPRVDAAVTWFTDLGGSRIMPVLAVLAAVALTLTWRSWTPALIVAVAASGSLFMTTTGKAVVGRVRPPTADAVAPFENSFSFPSGHTLNTTVIAGIVAYLAAVRSTRRAVKVTSALTAAVLALAMGLSRVYLGHHWLTDVLVAWALGISWLALLITGLRVWQLRIPPPDR